jgi:hypothetical protein
VDQRRCFLGYWPVRADNLIPFPCILPVLVQWYISVLVQCTRSIDHPRTVDPTPGVLNVSLHHAQTSLSMISLTSALSRNDCTLTIFGIVKLDYPAVPGPNPVSGSRTRIDSNDIVTLLKPVLVYHTSTR